MNSIRKSSLIVIILTCTMVLGYSSVPHHYDTKGGRVVYISDNNSSQDENSETTEHHCHTEKCDTDNVLCILSHSFINIKTEFKIAWYPVFVVNILSLPEPLLAINSIEFRQIEISIPPIPVLYSPLLRAPNRLNFILPLKLF